MKTGLYERHVALGAKMVDFSGWEMPVQYRGVIQEHHAVREKVGIFDVSHMGRVLVTGPDAEKLLDLMSTNKITGKKDFTATYTLWCHETGGVVDDLIVYRQGPDSFFVVVNAGNREKDLAHLRKEAVGFDVIIQPLYEDGILAVQGPLAKQMIEAILPEAAEVKPMRFTSVIFEEEEVILSGTGYTGSGGFELYGSTQVIVKIWDRLIEDGVEPIGLAARDTLRMEMGFALYGHELSDEILASETVSAWTIKWDKERFIGKDALEKNGQKRFEVGVILKDRGIAREGYPVLRNGKTIGMVTSGTQSPCLQQAIAMILVEDNLQQGENIEVEIRGKSVLAEVVPLPFWRNKK